jgi:hypothetical protein
MFVIVMLQDEVKKLFMLPQSAVLSLSYIVSYKPRRLCATQRWYQKSEYTIQQDSFQRLNARDLMWLVGFVKGDG